MDRRKDSVSVMKRIARGLAFLVLLLVGALPVSAIMTLMLIPVWRIIEERFGVESIGHSGPADWCFILMYVVWVTVAGAGWWVVRRRARR